jgi:hypothetical protein
MLATLAIPVYVGPSCEEDNLGDVVTETNKLDGAADRTRAVQVLAMAPICQLAEQFLVWLPFLRVVQPPVGNTVPHQCATLQWGPIAYLLTSFKLDAFSCDTASRK